MQLNHIWYIYIYIIMFIIIIIMLLYLRVWAACMYVWKICAEILEMAMEKAVVQQGLKLSRKRREDTGWVSMIIILYRPSDIWKW